MPEATAGKQSQASLGMLLRSSLAKTPKFLAAEWLPYFFKRSSRFFSWKAFAEGGC